MWLDMVAVVVEKKMALIGPVSPSKHAHCPAIGRTVWKGLEGVTLLDEGGHWDQALEFQKLMEFLVSSLCLCVETKI